MIIASWGERVFLSRRTDWPAAGLHVGRTKLHGWYLTLYLVNWTLIVWSQKQP